MITPLHFLIFILVSVTGFFVSKCLSHNKQKKIWAAEIEALKSKISLLDESAKVNNRLWQKKLDSDKVELRSQMQQWKLKEEKRVREDAIKRHKTVVGGKTTEHLVPYMEDFNYNPSDCRFLGSPIDIVVFDGLSDGEVRDVIFVEVKTGKSASLTKRERQVRDAILSKNVLWRLIKKIGPS